MNHPTTQKLDDYIKGKALQLLFFVVMMVSTGAVVGIIFVTGMNYGAQIAQADQLPDQLHMINQLGREATVMVMAMITIVGGIPFIYFLVRPSLISFFKKDYQEIKRLHQSPRKK